MTGKAATMTLTRQQANASQTLGELVLRDQEGKVLFECVTVELPWLENARRISCIPKGKYKVITRVSQKYSKHLHVLDVPNRDFILIHEANFVYQLKGCIGVGATFKDINRDGTLDITSSKVTKAKILEFIDGPVQLTVL